MMKSILIVFFAILPLFSLTAHDCAFLLRKISTVQADLIQRSRSTFGKGEMLTFIPEKISKRINRNIRFGSYNIEDLIDVVPERIGHQMNLIPFRKPDDQLWGAALAIEQMNLDIIGLQEVSKGELRFFNKEYLGNQYEVLLLQTNTDRHCDIGFLVRKDLPYKFELHSFRETEGIYMGEKVKVFARDFPTLVVKDKITDEPVVVYSSVHLKSKGRSPDYDFENYIRRLLEVETATDIVKKFRNKYGYHIPYLIGGDFNTKMGSPELESLFQYGFRDSLDESPIVDAKWRVTHTMHWKDGTTFKEQLDALLIDFPKDNNPLVEAGIHHYRNSSGEIYDLPQSYSQRSFNPSDHFPVYVELKL